VGGAVLSGLDDSQAACMPGAHWGPHGRFHAVASCRCLRAGLSGGYNTARGPWVGSQALPLRGGLRRGWRLLLAALTDPGFRPKKGGTPIPHGGVAPEIVVCKDKALIGSLVVGRPSHELCACWGRPDPISNWRRSMR